MRLFLVLLPCAVMACCLTGCGGGPAKAPVHGTVTWKGKPVEKGNITIQAENGPAVIGQIADGKYRLDGDKSVLVGKAKVAIDVFEEDGTEVVIGPGKKEKAVRQVAPAKYNSASTLSTKIEAGKDNQYNVDLTP